MFSFSKKLLTITTLSILIVFNILPVFAQTPAVAEPPMDCWPKDLCAKQKGNWAQTERSKKQCGAFEKNSGALGFCYAPPPQVNLQVAIGEKSVVAGLTDYIPNIYNYLVGIVSIVAIIMIMVGGLRYLTAGGNSSAITSAKETIMGAIIGLFLTFGSYILLQTINPALVQLKMPDIKKIRTTLLTTAGPCASGRGDIALGQKCNNTCECKQGKCIPMEAGVLELMGKGVALGAGAGIGLWTLGAGSIAGGTKTVLVMIQKTSQLALKLVKYLAPPVITTAVGNPITTAVVGYSLFNLPAGEPDKPGICIVEAKNNVSSGAWCQKDEHCISKKCICMPGLSGPGLTSMEGAKCLGVCGGGGVNAPCSVVTDCEKNQICVDNSNGTMTWRCTDFETDSPCSPLLAKGGGCWKDSDKPAKCVDVFLGTPGATSFLCKPVISGVINNQTVCATNSDCGYTSSFGDWQCVNKLCSKGELTHNCLISDYSPKPCKPGSDLVCAFDYVKIPTKLIEETGLQASYEHNSGLLQTWQAAHGSTTICAKSENVIEPSQVK